MPDGSVEIKITGSIDPSVAASANTAKAAMSDLGNSATVSAKTMAAALAQTGGSLKAIQPEMLGLGVAAKTAAAAQDGVAAASVASTVATEVNTRTVNSSRAAYESLALVHEALSGRFTRMVGTSTILAQALAGQAATTSAVSFITSGLGLAIIGTVAAIGLATAATISYEAEEKKLAATALGLGAQSRLTAQQLKDIGESADSASQSVRETTKAAEAFAATGLHNEETVKQLSNSVEAYSQLIGEKFAAAQKSLAEAMRDPVKGAKELHDQLGILDGDQLEQIQTLTALGEKDQAVAIITQALKQRIDEAKQAGVGVRGEFGSLIDVLSNVYNWIGHVTEGFGAEAETLVEDLIPALHQAGQAHRDAAAAARQQAQNEAELNTISAKGAKAYDATPEGQAAAKLNELKGNLSAAKDALAVDTAVHGAHSDAVKHDKEAVDDYSHAVGTYLTEVQKKTKADQLDVQIAAARHTHNKQLVADLTEQKTLLAEAGKVESDSDAKALAAGAGSVAGAKTFAPKGAKGPSIVSEWEEQLHAAEVASGEFFKDQTDDELKFWQDKVGLVKAGSKDWLAVQSKIFEAQKSLAHQAYDEHLADLNVQLEADRDNWKKEQADWQEKLAFIKSKYGEESAEFKNAHREFEAAEREHQQQMLQAQRDGEQKQIEALKQHLSATRQIRETDAQTAEALVKDQADGSVLGEAAAAARIGQIHAQLAQQEMVDDEVAYRAEQRIKQQEIADMEAAGKTETAAYTKAKQDQISAEQAFQLQRRELEAKAYQQQIQDILAVKQAYSNYISGTVNATISGLDGMISRTQNWRQAVIGVYQSVVSTFENAISKMASRWLVEHLFMTAAQRAQLTIQTAQHSAAELTKTAATTTGAISRAGVENTGFFAKLLSLLGISVGHHIASESAKTTATATGASTRAIAEESAATTSAIDQKANNLTLITSYAGVAGAAGTASFAAAPWPIDTGAPAFGAAMAQAAGAYASLASLDVGTNYLPRDQVVQMHEGERVIPKADNTKLIQMMGMASGGVDGGGRSDVHLHYAPTIHERERLGLKQLLASDGGALIGFIESAARDGKFKKLKTALAS